MAKNKTAETGVAVTDFINAFVDKPEKRDDSFRLVELMRQWSGFEPRMWGPSIIGFGKYHYRYASGHEGEAPLLGFSPRKAEFSLYVTDPEKDYDKFLKQLGKIRAAKSCIYFKKLADLDLKVLEKLCMETLRHMRGKPDVRGEGMNAKTHSNRG
jgi:hypothetical protein